MFPRLANARTNIPIKFAGGLGAGAVYDDYTSSESESDRFTGPASESSLMVT
jgi:hypothetical protein